MLLVDALHRHKGALGFFEQRRRGAARHLRVPVLLIVRRGTRLFALRSDWETLLGFSVGGRLIAGLFAFDWVFINSIGTPITATRRISKLTWRILDQIS